MDINHAPAKLRDGGGRDALQISCEHDELGVPRGRYDLTGIVGVREHGRAHPRPPRAPAAAPLAMTRAIRATGESCSASSSACRFVPPPETSTATGICVTDRKG